MVVSPRVIAFQSVVLFFVLMGGGVIAQPGATLLKWTSEGNAFYEAKAGGIIRLDVTDNRETVIVAREWLKPAGRLETLGIRNFAFSEDGKKVLVYTNARRVWRYDTRGDYWVLDLSTRQLTQIGKDRPASSLQFAKFSPDGSKVAYVSEHNIYIEDLAGGQARCLTSTNGTRKLINGTYLKSSHRRGRRAAPSRQWCPSSDR